MNPAGNYMFKVNSRNTRTRCADNTVTRTRTNMFKVNNKDTRRTPVASDCVFILLKNYLNFMGKSEIRKKS